MKAGTSCCFRHGGVLDCADHDVPGRRCAGPDGHVVGLGCAGREDDFLRVAAEKGSDMIPGSLNGVSSRTAVEVCAGRVPDGAQGPRHCFDRLRAHGRGGVVVEVDQSPGMQRAHATPFPTTTVIVLLGHVGEPSPRSPSRGYFPAPAEQLVHGSHRRDRLHQERRSRQAADLPALGSGKSPICSPGRENSSRPALARSDQRGHRRAPQARN